ncbi:MAG: PIN domain-containing protein, partial [Lysobacterales bacterium]
MNASKRTYVLDTNVLMHDPTSLFRFEEHDILLPMVVLEELDAAKKGTTEVARNVRQVSRFLNELIQSHGNGNLDGGIPLLRPHDLRLDLGGEPGRLHFQTTTDPAPVPVAAGLKNSADNQIIHAVLELRERLTSQPVVLVSKDI